MKLIFTTFIMVLCLQAGAAQVTYFTDSLQLRGGGWATGRVLRYHRSGSILLEKPNGFTHAYKAKDIVQIIVHSSESEHKTGAIRPPRERNSQTPCDRPYAFSERGWYGITYAGTVNGFDFSNQMQWGLNLQQVAGFQWNRMLGAGIGIGLENFSIENTNGPFVLPVYAEARGYFLKKNTTPYYALNAGYGFAFKAEEQGILEAKGGWRWHPALGFRLGAGSGANFLFDVGYVFQNVTLRRGINPGNREILTQDIVYKRFSLRLGLVF